MRTCGKIRIANYLPLQLFPDIIRHLLFGKALAEFIRLGFGGFSQFFAYSPYLLTEVVVLLVFVHLILHLGGNAAVSLEYLYFPLKALEHYLHALYGVAFLEYHLALFRPPQHRVCRSVRKFAYQQLGLNGSHSIGTELLIQPCVFRQLFHYAAAEGLAFGGAAFLIFHGLYIRGKALAGVVYNLCLCAANALGKHTGRLSGKWQHLSESTEGSCLKYIGRVYIRLFSVLLGADEYKAFLIHSPVEGVYAPCSARVKVDHFSGQHHKAPEGHSGYISICFLVFYHGCCVPR